MIGVITSLQSLSRSRGPFDLWIIPRMGSFCALRSPERETHERQGREPCVPHICGKRCSAQGDLAGTFNRSRRMHPQESLCRGQFFGQPLLKTPRKGKALCRRHLTVGNLEANGGPHILTPCCSAIRIGFRGATRVCRGAKTNKCKRFPVLFRCSGHCHMDDAKGYFRSSMMSSATMPVGDALDYCNTHLDIDAASVLLRLSVKAGQRPNLKRLDPVEPPRVPPPTRASSPSPDSDSDFAIHQLKWLAPLTPVDYESPESSPLSSPDTDAADSDGDVHYFFLPPVTPLDFKHGTSELWRSLDNDPADSDSATATGSGAEYSACHARARRQPRQSIRNTLDDCDGPSEGDRPKEECAAKAEDDSV